MSKFDRSDVIVKSWSTIYAADSTSARLATDTSGSVTGSLAIDSSQQPVRGGESKASSVFGRGSLSLGLAYCYLNNMSLQLSKNFDKIFSVELDGSAYLSQSGSKSSLRYRVALQLQADVSVEFNRRVFVGLGIQYFRRPSSFYTSYFSSDTSHRVSFEPFLCFGVEMLVAKKFSLIVSASIDSYAYERPEVLTIAWLLPFYYAGFEFGGRYHL